MAATRYSRKPARRAAPQKREPLRFRGFGGPLMFAVAILAAIFVMSVFFRITVIQVKGNVHYTEQEIVRACAIEQGDNLFFFDRIAAISRALSKLPYLEDVSVERKLPNRVTITVKESTALAYLELGDEQWTLDHRCKVLGKAAEGETETLIPVVGIRPGTLMIGERMETDDHDVGRVDYLAAILDQLEGRGLTADVTEIDFTKPSSPELGYGGKYTLVLGSQERLEYKFGMFVSVLEQLKPGDVGIIDVSDAATAHFSPN